jgi:hypothetical protein
MGLGPERLYLTHYSQVTDLSRLAKEMHAGIDAYVALALRYEHDADRGARLCTALMDYYVERLGEHGYAGDRDAIASTLAIDIALNAQGLEVWLERRR